MSRRGFLIKILLMIQCIVNKIIHCINVYNEQQTEVITNFLFTFITHKIWEHLAGVFTVSLREKCPNTEFFLVQILAHSDWIWRDSLNLFIFSPNAGKYGPEKTLYLDTFHAVLKLYSQRRIQSAMKHLRWSFLWKQLVAYSCYLFSQKALS